MAKVLISENRLRSLLAAEEFCRAARLEYSASGLVTSRSWPWFDQWMRRTGKGCFKAPLPTSPHWCSLCKRRHISGEHSWPNKQ